ncbi:hypothetical protein [Actinoallomurus iriomotensis]|uniref:Uncharacterized protein n=1 Tax=Actinoallomurus iriomotensis TaxID=478107 RepID=A0A9W6SFQ5_9ACTN|nr:hypothetical protein [Actinoallomurus iriomotensis]GLY92731.1 hypothetical protein Airi02_106590 [Actinoallomurus iriomotensis]
MRSRIAAILTATVAITGVGLGAPAVSANATSYPVTKFNVTYGNTYTKGTITWYSRSVTLAGVEKSVDRNSCRGTTAYTLNSDNKQLGKRRANIIPCGTSSNFSVTVPANAPGGAAVVRVCLDTEVPVGGTVKLLRCVRYGR